MSAGVSGGGAGGGGAARWQPRRTRRAGFALTAHDKGVDHVAVVVAARARRVLQLNHAQELALRAAPGGRGSGRAQHASERAQHASHFFGGRAHKRQAAAAARVHRGDERKELQLGRPRAHGFEHLRGGQRGA
jgi:hypothetical protein